MDIVLDDAEIRVLGCLIEKEMATPEYYPMSLNSLTNACNQKSNRSPVVMYDEEAVSETINRLQHRGLVRSTHAAGGRVIKYVHTVLEKFDLSQKELAILCELMVRGPQTIGELRSHTERLSGPGGLDEIEAMLRGLVDHDPPLVRKMTREIGRKESRYQHLFSGNTVSEDVLSETPSSSLSPQERISALEADVSALRAELEGLKKEFESFKSQF